MIRLTRAAAKQISQTYSTESGRKRAQSSSPDVELRPKRSKKIKKENELLEPPTTALVSPSPPKPLPRIKDLKSKKLTSFAQFQNLTPFPDFPHPTPAECKLAHEILSSLHGARTRPTTVVAPSVRSGCGDSPSVLDALVRTILSQNTNNQNSTRAKLSMDKAYGRSDKWEEIVAGGQAKLQEVIKCGGLSTVKSKVILNLLEQVHCKYGVYSLDHLHSATNEEAMQEMLSFRGVGFKTASCVLLFCLQRESFAVDTHVWRITGLLGWLPKGASRDEAYRHLDVRVPSEDKYGLHILLITHGRTCEECRAGSKALGKCELRLAFKQAKIRGVMTPEEPVSGQVTEKAKKAKVKKKKLEEKNVKVEEDEEIQVKQEYDELKTEGKREEEEIFKKEVKEEVKEELKEKASGNG